MNRIDYDDRLHLSYREGRALVDSAMQLWRETLRRHVSDRAGLTILDLGSGTGRFSALLADETGAEVVGVEPSDRMRAVAEAECRHPRVRFLAGSAERIPLEDHSCDTAWLSQVVHHFPDLTAAARELSRVVRESGVVIVRNNFNGRLADCARYYEFFPTALTADRDRHPTVEQVEHCFHRHGFETAAFETIEQIEAPSLKEYADRIRLRTYSTFELISEDEFAAGLAALDAAAAREQIPQPVFGKIDILVLRRQAG